MLTGIDPDQALGLVLSHASQACRREVETVALADALHRTLAETVCADRDYPPFTRAMMDGYAVVAADAGRRVQVTGEVAAGQLYDRAVTEGHAISIMTGAACPPGTEAVVMKETVQVDGDGVWLPVDLKPGQHMVPKGSECADGAPAVAAGSLITTHAIGALAAVGQERVLVLALPAVAVVTTGAEVVPAHATPGEAEIRDSNRFMLAGLVRELQLPPPLLLHAGDTRESLDAALARVAGHDIVVISGGVSVGRYDLVPQAIGDCGATVIFHKVTQKPGKPLLFATRERQVSGDASGENSSRNSSQLIFGLPGHPLSSCFCFYRYVATAARQMMGGMAAGPEARIFRGRLAAGLCVESDRTVFVPARAQREEGDWALKPLVGQGSGDIFSCTAANAYVRLSAGRHRLEPGDAVAFEWMREPG